MDPRIDLSSVAIISATKISSDIHNYVSTATDMKVTSTGSEQNKFQNDHEENADHGLKNALLNQYTDLITTLEGSSSIQALADVHLSNEDEGSESSMVVLARVKRKYLKDLSRAGGKEIHEEVKEVIITNEFIPPRPKRNSIQNSVQSNSNGESQSNSNGESTENMSSLGSSSGGNRAKHHENIDHNGGTNTQTRNIITESGGGTTNSDRAAIKREPMHQPIQMKAFPDAATLERLALKKRKRLDKRREYEEEVQRQLHDSGSDTDNRKVFEAGTMITMEEALSFSSSARYVDDVNRFCYLQL